MDHPEPFEILSTLDPFGLLSTIKIENLVNEDGEREDPLIAPTGYEWYLAAKYMDMGGSQSAL